MGTDHDLAVQVRFPDAASDAMYGRTYWLTGDEHAFVTLEIQSGDLYDGPARPMALAVFANGTQVAPLIDGVEAHNFDFVLEPHSSRVVELEFDERVLPAGIHQIALALWEPRGRAGVGPIIYAIREEWCFSDRPRYLTGEEESWDVEWGSASWVVDARTDLLPPEVELAPGEDLELEVFYAAGQEAAAEPRYLVALVDGEQVPFEGGGTSPVLQVELGTSLRTRLRIAADRLSGNRARVDLFEIGGVHLAPEDANGNLIRVPNFRAWRMESFDVIHP